MDLAEQIDDYICSFESIRDIAMDSLAMFIFIWAVLALFLVWLCKFLYNKYMNKNATATTSSSRNNSLTSPTAIANGAKLNGGDKLRSSEPRDISASKEVKELSAKPLTAGVGRSRAITTGGGGGGGGGGTAAGVGVAGTSIRKRVVRQSSTGPESRKKRYVPPPSNVVGPETTSVTWTSQVFRWLYSDLVIVNELLTSWVIALNDTLKKSLEEHGVAVEIVRVLPDTPPPGLSNIFCNCDESNPADMVITFDCEAMPVLQVKSYRQKSGKVDTSHYKVTVSRFRARMSTTMNYNNLKGEMQVEGYPDVRISMNSVGAIKAIDQDEQRLQDVISEILTNALRLTIYPIDFSIYATCPRAEIAPADISTMEGLTNTSMQSQSMASGRRLLVKIVKGEGLNDANDPYVVVEMDEPAQKNQTGARQGNNPYWDEHFLFELTSQSAEILFEVYDRPTNQNDSPKFLGLGLVGIDELAVGPASSQILALQPRPYETQTVSGAITVDFVFIEGAEIPSGPRPYKLKEALRISNSTVSDQINNSGDVADAAMRALQDGALTANGGNPHKSTLIIHSVQRNNNNSNAFKVDSNKDGKLEIKEFVNEANVLESSALESLPMTMIAPTTPTTKSHATDNDLISNDQLNTFSNSPADSCPTTEQHHGYDVTGKGNEREYDGSLTEFGYPNAASSPNHQQINGTNGTLGTNGTMSFNNSYNSNSLPYNNSSTVNNGTDLNQNQDDRGRSKKRNFFGTLKKRLGRSKTRTNSADRGTDGMIPIDGTFNGPRIGVPTLDHSRRSSLSESSAVSGFSSASNKTYVHEASTLVLETIENGIKRHFIVPLAIAQRPKWRRKGTKLHIYNDHTFIAKHLSGSGLQCAICTKSIPRRPGKQGYECRDCQMICHKQCHIRAPQACPNPTVLSMELTKLNSAAADRSIRKL